jgi:hypothetical protein
MDKISDCNHKLATDIHDSTVNLIAMFDKIDVTIAENRRIAARSDEDDYPELQQALAESMKLSSTVFEQREVIENPLHFPIAKTPTINWSEIFEIAKDRGEYLLIRGADVCSICIQTIVFPRGVKLLKPLLLLDCSHVYHEACLSCFQRSGRSDCPVCRRKYASKRIC